jgi:hypothetical protein
MNGMMVQFLQQVSRSEAPCGGKGADRRSVERPKLLLLRELDIAVTQNQADSQYGPVFFEAAGTSLSSYGAWEIRHTILPSLPFPVRSSAQRHS